MDAATAVGLIFAMDVIAVILVVIIVRNMKGK